MSESANVRWHILFSGRVQHVGFRYTAYYRARDLYLTGWVDNLPDGRVEMEIQGPVANLRRFLLQMKSERHIHIEHAVIKEIPIWPHDRGFSVKGY
ncbi:MAG: acylphosphatase [Lachnospiraceae bacterium]|nr:acylphosphatase [Lachnospiraceae bacterium]